MLYIFIIFLILSLIGISFKNVKNVDKSALSHERTIMIIEVSTSRGTEPQKN